MTRKTIVLISWITTFLLSVIGIILNHPETMLMIFFAFIISCVYLIIEKDI